MALKTFKIVPVSRISREHPFSYRYSLKDPVLERTIRLQGILVPLVVEMKKDRYQIIAGHRRFEAARSLKHKEVPVLEVEGKLAAKDAWILCLTSNWRQETSDMDRVKAVTKAREFKLKPEEIRNDVMPLLGLPPDQRMLDLYLKADNLPASLKDLLEEKKIPFRGCGALLRFSKVDQNYFGLNIGKKMQLTTSQFIQVADWLADIVKREGGSLAVILRRDPFKKILGHKSMDPRTRAGQFFKAVKVARFPGYEAHLERFEKARALILREDKELGIEPPVGFEEKGIDLHARVKTPKDLDRILRKLSESRPALNSLFDFML